jgi:hypothetical protein
VTAQTPQADLAQRPNDSVTAARPLSVTIGPLECFTAGRWPLLIILTMQAALSAHLIWANTAFTDEALYLTAGHLEWSHWLDGTPVTSFQVYFSGSPVIYPPIGAAADAMGGLAAARGLSLGFMLVATVLLHGVAKRIFSRAAATFAAALFAGIGATQYLGAFATYDAMALTLLALATWLGVRAADRNCAIRLILLILAGLLVVLADATKYAATLFDPVVILTAVLTIWQRRGRGSGLGAALTMCGAVGLSLAGALLAGGHSYWLGIQFTTLSRAASTSSTFGVVLVSMGWAGVVGVLAVIGAVTTVYGAKERSRKALGAVLAGAVWMAPAEQARIHTFTSLFKHVGFGEWFGAIVAGFALASIITAIPRAKAEGGLRASWAATVLCAVIGFTLATNQFAAWPNITGLITALRPVLKAHPHAVLATDNGNAIEYYLEADGIVSREFVIDEQAQWETAFNGSGFAYRDSATGKEIYGLDAYNLAIRTGYFSVIALSDYRAWMGADKIIHKDILKDRDYRLAISRPYVAGGEQDTFQVWVYTGSR